MSDNVSVLLIGCGKMGGAMLAGWRQWPGFEAAVVEPKAPVETASNITLYTDASELPAGLKPDAVIAAVKPQEMDNVARSTSGSWGQAPCSCRLLRAKRSLLSSNIGATVPPLCVRCRIHRPRWDAA